MQTAQDGSDHREAAFDALVESANYWPPINLRDLYLPDAERDLLMNQPSLHRGRAFRVRGRLEQAEILPEPYSNVSRWFVRDRTGRPMMVFVCGPLDPAGYQIGSNVELPVRFYKRIDAKAQDGRSYSYPAFVGARPTQSTQGSYFLALLRAVAGVVAAVGVVALWLTIRKRSGQRPESSQTAAPGAGADPT